MKTTTGRPRSRVRKTCTIVVACLAALCILLIVNAARLKSRQIKVPPIKPGAIDQDSALANLSAAVQLPTISHRNRAKNNTMAFQEFQTLLESSYPAVTSQMSRYTGEDFGDPHNASLLYQWRGSSDQDTSAVLLMAHYDVVPVEQSTLAKWKHPPFSGANDGEYLWGRGTLDDKSATIALMEACERLINAGFRPQRDVYLAFGHDEEVGGKYGNQQISDWMRSRGIRLSMVLDEGGGIYRSVPGLEQPAALIGIAEKGFLNLTMTAQLDDAGHAAIPPQETAIVVLANAITKLQQNPFPTKLDGGISRMLDYLGPEMSFFHRLAIGNRQLFGSLVENQFSNTPAGNAALRTTLVPTMIEAGFTENALPSSATANLHLRIQPGETVESSVNFVRSVIQDERITLSTDRLLNGTLGDQLPFREPSRISSDTNDSFQALHRTIKQVYPNVAVAPFYVVASTDSAHYDDPALSQDVYRFTPWNLDQTGLTLIHGVNERVSTSQFVQMIRFYEQLVINLAGSPQD